MKIDPYNHKGSYLTWKERVKSGIPNITKENSDLILNYLKDMEIGANVAKVSVKGARSYIRLNSLKDRLGFFAKNFEIRYNLKIITDIKEDQLINFFGEIKNGGIKKRNGCNYASLDTFAKIFKAFWHWHQKINRKRGIEIPDITNDLDVRQEKPDWVYLTEEQVKILAESAKYEYKVIILFLHNS